MICRCQVAVAEKFGIWYLPSCSFLPPFGSKPTWFLSSTSTSDLRDDVVVNPNKVSQQQANKSLVIISSVCQSSLYLTLAQNSLIRLDESHDLWCIYFKWRIRCYWFNRGSMKRNLAINTVMLACASLINILVVQLHKLLFFFWCFFNIVRRKTGLRVQGHSNRLSANLFRKFILHVAFLINIWSILQRIFFVSGREGLALLVLQVLLIHKTTVLVIFTFCAWVQGLGMLLKSF